MSEGTDMNTTGRIALLLGVTAVASLVFPARAAAYVGPGVGLAIIATAIAVIGAVIATIGGFVWYPVKRILKALGRGKIESPVDDE
jgi:hypothetical protein